MDEMKFCHKCGAQILKEAEICVKCGVRQHDVPNSANKSIDIKINSDKLFEELGLSSEKNKIVAGIFAIVLGGLGVHKFYLNKPVLGILYLIFCWTSIPSLIGLIEGIIYLTRTDEEFARKFVN